MRIKQHFSRIEKLMGNRFEICLVHEDSAFANLLLTKAVNEIKRIERLLTTFDSKSQTNLINGNAGIRPQNVDEEVFNLIARSIKISSLTQGAFDISYGGLDKSLWNFDTKMAKLPNLDMAKEMVKNINFQLIELNSNKRTVFLKKKGMRIGFGGIGKGYAADMAMKLIRKQGIESGFVNASGDLVTWGEQANGKSWNIGITNPVNSENHLGKVNISNMAIATSGNYEKFAIIDGKRYSHTIDPKTGYPVTGIKSVSIMCKQAELADALTTPIMVMGKSAGLNLINQLNNVECLLVDDQNKIFLSENLKLYNQ